MTAQSINSVRTLVGAFLLALLAGLSYSWIFPLREFDVSSDQLVADMLALPHDNPLRGWLVTIPKLVQLPVKETRWMTEWLGAGGAPPYTPQFGLQALVADHVQRATGLGVATTLAVVQFGGVMLHALAFALIAAWTCRRFGWQGAVVFALLAIANTGAWRWVGSVYWPAGLTLLIFAWCLAAPVRRPVIYGTGVFLLFLVRFLCGYEYITSISLGALACLAMNRAATGAPMPWRLAAAAWMASVAAFFAAFALHLHRLTGLGMTWGEAWEIVRAPAIYRTYGQPTWADNKGLISYLANLVSPWLQNGILPMLGLGLLVILLGMRVAPAAETNRLSLVRRACLYGFLASMSWYLFGFGHMKTHPHLGGLIFCMPFTWLLAIAVTAHARPLWEVSRESRVVSRES